MDEQKAGPLGPAFAFLGFFDRYDRNVKVTVDGELYLSIIRPTSGAVETENSLVNNELCEIRQQVASVYRSQKEVEKEVLTAACNAVEFASR
ncbi:hypothetical protein, partial [Pseudomonas proteolytica]|uniref:hypothetical protein n=2 Tax=Pseudomonas proteolytica TaxID=219574 RepID=UPI0030DDB521